MENTTFDNKIAAEVNHFPSITWHHLHINHGYFEGSIDSEIDFSIQNPSPFVEISKIPLKDLNLPKIIDTQFGKDFDGAIERILRDGTPETNQFFVNCIKIKDYSKIEQPIKIVFNPENLKNQVGETVIIAGEGSCAAIDFEYENDKDCSGLFGHRIKIFCKPNSNLKLSTVNLLGREVLHYNGIGASLEENSVFDLTQIDLGAKEVVTGSLIDLDGFGAKSNVHAGYFSAENHSVDVNYIARHRGKETSSSCFYNGIVDGESKKSWRGTIDFLKGCTDSVGDEQENVLLLSPDVVNKSMPVILCGEEDVDGRHGSSIGRLNEEELLYLETRGINKSAARAMMIKSKINAVARFVSSKDLQEKIQNHLEGIL